MSRRVRDPRAHVPAAGREVPAAWGAFLAAHEWSHYVTLTFRTPRPAEGAARAFVHQFVRRLTRWAQGPVPWFCAAECGPGAQTWHVHALVYGTGALTGAEVARAWTQGQTRVLCYDALRGAAHYVTKAVLEEATWYDVSRRLPPRRARAA